MWLFTTTGFISAVYKEGALQVRARDKESLETFANHANVAIINTPYADYPYRVVSDNRTFSEWMHLQITNLTYPNFKSEIAATRGYEFAKPLNKVWSVMHEVEDSYARVKN